ncbi:PLP-dependent aminotransferase family protein [Streptococcus sp. SGI.013]|uniref:aminotransferase-like domain-containing protein n=1 Tax=unclassified Streptococcus TaxID=2608887 RepID=UPI003D03496A
MTSIYQNIVNQLSHAILSGQFKKGDKLPSIRQLSKDYHCSKDTVQRALLELKYQNLIYPVKKSGYYVLEDNEPAPDVSLKLQDYNNKTYDDFRLCLEETLKGRKNYLFNYYHSQAGLEDLLISLENYFSNQTIYTKKDQIVITAGSQQALYILTQLDFPNQKKKILLEQPTYYRMNDMVKAQNLPFTTISRGFGGLNLKELETIFKNDDIKFFYTISRFSNPLGLSYSLEEKQAILDLAYRYNVYIVEDDYMGDFSRTNDLPLHYYDTRDRVIYLKSFSMSVFPALRLGAVVLPKIILKAFLDYKSLIDYDTNLIMQKALSLYLDNGMFDQNLKRLRQYFQNEKRKAETLLDKIQIPFPYHLSIKTMAIEVSKEKKWDLKKNSAFQSLTKSYLIPTDHHYLQIPIDSKLEHCLDNLK